MLPGGELQGELQAMRAVAGFGIMVHLWPRWSRWSVVQQTMLNQTHARLDLSDLAQPAKTPSLLVKFNSCIETLP